LVKNGEEEEKRDLRSLNNEYLDLWMPVEL
jgi:hypothetical protein